MKAAPLHTHPFTPQKPSYKGLKSMRFRHMYNHAMLCFAMQSCSSWDNLASCGIKTLKYMFIFRWIKSGLRQGHIFLMNQLSPARPVIPHKTNIKFSFGNFYFFGTNLWKCQSFHAELTLLSQQTWPYSFQQNIATFT